MMKRQRWVTIAVSVLLIAAIAWGFYQRYQNQMYMRYLSSMYDKSFYELIDSMDNIEVKLEKLLVADNSVAGNELVADIWRQSYSVSENLSMIPANNEKTHELMAFVNRLGEYLRSVSKKERITNADMETIGDLINVCRGLNGDIRAIYLAGTDIYDSVMDESGSFIDDIASSGIDYPTLIYDGPFSDAGIGEAKGLPDNLIDAKEAEEIVKEFTGSIELTQLSDADGEIPCYLFAIENATVAVTKKGGKVLWMLPDELPKNINLQLSDAIESAAQILLKNGFPDMHMTHWQLSGASVLMTFIAVQDDVLLYPDMVKLIISLEDGSVIGIDTGNYWRNHVERDHFDQIITKEVAEGNIDSRARLKSSRLCLIPINNREVFCHELKLVYNDSIYYKYIDAVSGEVVEVLKLINTEFGNQVI